jgi:putative (di)nucleoside polyphosphate hydrolase
MKKTTTHNPPPEHPPSHSSASLDPAKYRPGVGIVLFNKDGLVLIAERLDNPGGWQMPQGGIDEGEEPEVAVFREMEEEIGTRNARIIGMVDDWIYYDFPSALGKKLWGGRYAGQRQKWIALRFLGKDSDIILDTHHDPEFSRWKWVPLQDLMQYVVPFKRAVYERVIKEFAKFPSSSG